MPDITLISLAHARCSKCGWMGEGFLTATEARDDAEFWHVDRCPGPAQANADQYPTLPDSEDDS
ncbi:MAG: hypothetical protein RJQ01_08035 [Microcella sp.]|uniref:hypothetical protein n=1 Tax=Microcella sp. TaxID=1913979 RepID=UPI003314E271